MRKKGNTLLLYGGYDTMSRSYKKVPVVRDHDSGKNGKRFANKAVRKKEEDALKGKEYKKVYPSYNIHDYRAFYPKEEAIKDWYEEEKLPEHSQTRHRRYKTLERWLIAWEKMMLRK